MRELTTCHSCRRYVAPDFAYCPYCGAERARNYEFRRLLDTPFGMMERSVQEYSFHRLEMIEQQLRALEVDLQQMLENRTSSRS